MIMLSNMHTYACPFSDNAAVATRVMNGLDLLAAEHTSSGLTVSPTKSQDSP